MKFCLHLKYVMIFFPGIISFENVILVFNTRYHRVAVAAGTKIQNFFIKR